MKKVLYVLFLALVLCNNAHAWKTTTTSEAELTTALEKTSYAVVKFAATWCGACKSMESLDATLEAQHSAKVTFIKVDIDQAKDSATKHAIQGVPTYIFYRRGLEVSRQTGAMTQAEYSQKITALMQ